LAAITGIRFRIIAKQPCQTHLDSKTVPESSLSKPGRSASGGPQRLAVGY
jgi:hypothetical protein